MRPAQRLRCLTIVWIALTAVAPAAVTPQAPPARRAPDEVELRRWTEHGFDADAARSWTSDYNVATAAFPSKIVAAAFAFMSEEFFELGNPEEARQPVNVAF